MNKKSIARVGAVAMVASAMLAAAVTPANANLQENGSYAALYLYNGSAALNNSDTFSWGFDAEVYGSASSSDASSALLCPVASDGAKLFISPRGSESTPGAWSAFGDSALQASTHGVLLPALTPGAMTNAVANVKTPGGNFSMGVACVHNNGVAVDRVYYRHIIVTAGTGAWTSVATIDYLPTPTISGTAAVGSTLTANLTNAPTEGYTIGYQWKRGNTNVGTNSNTYAVVDADGYSKMSVVVTYTRTSDSSVAGTKTSAQTASVTGGSVQIQGTTAVSASVSAADNGILSLALNGTSAAPVSFGAANLVNGQSVSTASFGGITVSDTRVVTRQGWDLSADVDDFVKSDASTVKIEKKHVGMSSSIDNANTTATGVSAASSVSAGSATYPRVIASGLPAAANVQGTYEANTPYEVGTTTVNIGLTLKAPQWKPAGTYNSVVTVTVASK